MVAYSSLTYQESHASCDHLENQGLSVVGTSDFNVYVNQLGILLKMKFLVQGTGMGPSFCISNKLPCLFDGRQVTLTSVFQLSGRERGRVEEHMPSFLRHRLRRGPHLLTFHWQALYLYANKGGDLGIIFLNYGIFEVETENRKQIFECGALYEVKTMIRM